MEDQEQIAEFTAYVQGGGKVEAGDWMPDEYRLQVLRFVEMHANSELMGVLPEREWINRAPTLKRKLALTAKVQDEVGHAELLYRVAEDLGKSREAMLVEFVESPPEHFLDQAVLRPEVIVHRSEIDVRGGRHLAQRRAGKSMPGEERFRDAEDAFAGGKIRL